MGRLGLSYEAFAKAAYGILENNSALKVDDITIEKVRAILKTGSNGTLGPYLKMWKEQVKKGEEWSGKRISEEMEVLTGLYGQLKSAANANIKQIQEESRIAVEEATQALQKVTNENNWLQDLVEQQKDSLEEVNNQRNILADENSTLTNKCEEFELQLGEKREEILRLTEINKNLSVNLERFHDASASERQKLELMHEKDVAELMKEITELRDSKETLLGDLAEVKTDISIWCTRAEEREKAIGMLTEINKNLEEKITAHVKEVVDLNSNLIIQRKEFNDLQKEFEVIEKENQDNISTIHQFEQNWADEVNARSELQKQLQQAGAIVESLTKKNYDLAKEKIESGRKMETVKI